PVILFLASTLLSYFALRTPNGGVGLEGYADLQLLAGLVLLVTCGSMLTWELGAYPVTAPSAPTAAGAHVAETSIANRPRNRTEPNPRNKGVACTRANGCLLSHSSSPAAPPWAATNQRWIPTMIRTPPGSPATKPSAASWLSTPREAPPRRRRSERPAVGCSARRPPPPSGPRAERQAPARPSGPRAEDSAAGPTRGSVPRRNSSTRSRPACASA